MDPRPGCVLALPCALLLLLPAAAQEQKSPSGASVMPRPAAASAFERFLHRVRLRWDSVWLHIESNGLPDHEMMTQITAWQQQVPLPHDYRGDNAWRVPLTPVPAKQPRSAKDGFFRGAIAIAVNGVPIFNPIKNDGVTDTYLAGELDLFGGHAGRADDYHYHLAPVFLNGGDPSRPIAYALDGYPIYGFDEPDGSPCRPLDTLNGHADPRIGYHYHATRHYPYLNGGFHGEVREEGGQVEPQPHAHPVREATTPLRGAIVTGFQRSADNKTFLLTYEQGGKQGTVRYTLGDDDAVHFVFRTPDGATKEQTYRRDPHRENQAGEAAQRPTGDGRLPWLAVHFGELDADRDAVLTAEELAAECVRTHRGYDRDGDQRVTTSERDAAGAGRSAMGGFVKQHWSEVDTDHDDVVTAEEIRASAERMFQRADVDRNGRVTAAEAQDQSPSARNRGEGNRDGAATGRRSRGYAVLDTAFHTDVPDHPFDIVLVNPTPSAITASVISYRHGDAFVRYSTPGAALAERTPTQHVHEGLPARFELHGLRPNTLYTYQLVFRAEGEPEFVDSQPFSFHTPRSPADTFTFTIQADSHLDTNMTPALYAQTLANSLVDRPDFHIDLGDTFMTDKRREFRDAAPQYMAQRYYFGLLCHSAPLFQVLGNHDGENGYSGRALDEIGGWSFAQRTLLFPPPEVDNDGRGYYRGRTSWRDGSGANYYTFVWGCVQVIVLDPFWATTTRARGGGNEVELTDESWRMTLGREQYDWLAATLAGSEAPWRFVFLHHLVGGRGRVARGGAEASPYFEWGGRNADGSDGFAARRPGWPMPIHELLVRHGVAAVFHGHDHLYVHGERDGIAYQCVPQPGNERGGTRSAAEYGYSTGTVLGSPGHLRVTVGPRSANVAYVRSALAGGRSGQNRTEQNGAVVREYTLQPRATR